MTSCYLPIKGNSKKTTELGELGKVLDCSYWHVHSIKNSWKGAVLVICVCCHFSGLARNPWYVRILWGCVFSFMSKALNEMSGIIWDYQHTALIKLLWYLLQQLFQFLVLFCHKPLDAQLDGIAKIQKTCQWFKYYWKCYRAATDWSNSLGIHHIDKFESACTYIMNGTYSCYSHVVCLAPSCCSQITMLKHAPA